MKTKIIKSRKDLAKTLLSSLERLVNKEDVEYLIFNLWGEKGCGKTFLLKTIAEAAFKNYGSQVKVSDIIDIEENSEEVKSLIFNRATWDDGYVQIYLIDNFNSLPQSSQQNTLLSDFEDHFLTKIITKGQAIVVVTSPHEIRHWKSIDIRSRSRSMLIPPLEEHEIKDFTKKQKLSYSEIYKKTFGHPKLIEWTVNDTTLNTNQLDDLFLEFFLPETSSELKNIAWTLSLSPFFSIPAYQKSLNIVGLRNNESYFNDLTKIKELGYFGLVTYDTKSGMYIFANPATRNILARSYRRKHPENAKRIYEVLSDLFIREASLSGFIATNFLSAIYHQLWNSILHDFSFPKWLNTWYKHTKEAWKDVKWASIKKEMEDNTANLYILNEIKELTDDTTFKNITIKISDARRQK